MCFSRVMHGGVSGGGGGGRDHIKDPLEVGEFVESLGVYENKSDTLSRKENVTAIISCIRLPIFLGRTVGRYPPLSRFTS